ncbi:MAG: DUF349 domain-containing protein [Bacteroidetes bacterium]|nr:DUF349 domain-containing protein [Bacteroidota bacterium]
MKKSENTHQIPESGNTRPQEENSSPVGSTETESTETLPTDSVQTQEEKPAEEVKESLPVAQEEMSKDDPSEEIHPLGDPPGILPETEEEEEHAAEATSPEELPEIPPVRDEEDAREGPSEELPPAGEIHEFMADLREEHAEDELPEEMAYNEVHELEEDINTLTREQLVSELEKTVNEPDLNAVKTRIALIKVAFLKKKKEENLQQYETIAAEEGHKEVAPAVEDPLDTRFNEFFNIYKANKARFNEEQEKIKLLNLKKKNQILEELRVLVNSEETLKRTYDEFKNLQDRWKEIGMVPRTEINNLWQNYHFLVEKFFDKVKLNKELKDLDLKKNLEAKIALCEKTEELLLETSVLKTFKKLQKYHEEWKDIGPVPLDKKEEIWERFKNTTDKINELRREHYSKVEDEQVKNLETKTALCEQGEDVLTLKNETVKDWQTNTNKVNELLKIWKSIGPVPQKTNTEIWNRFKSSLDSFFASKKDFFDKLKDQQVHNYNLKVELCMQAESLKNSTDWKKTSNDLIRLQNEWKSLGPVPKKYSDKIWKRFRTACDEFFNAKSAYFSSLQSNEAENLNKKTDLIRRIKETQFGADKSENLNVLKNFQREWTEIGHIPIKEKDRIQNEFRSLINEFLNKLQISEIEMTAVSYQSHVDSLKNDPQSKRLIGKEREILSGKILKMKEDINLWENNIGFFANSKNAAILKEEFEKKINKAKSDVKVMEAKLKLLKTQ